MIGRPGFRGPLVAALLCLLGGALATSSAAAPVPLAPIGLSAAGQDAEAPQVAIDAGGNAVAVWTRSNGSHDIVQSSPGPPAAPGRRRSTSRRTAGTRSSRRWRSTPAATR